jgi:ubiquinone/menaquinone biosynthesis C-methylase UbiE
MDKLLRQFPWPPLPGSQTPVWNGKEFLVEDQPHAVLCYETADSHWSPELTDLHEAEAGSNHPIDCASRALAIRSIEQCAAGRDLMVLDVGCSSGFLLEELRERKPDLALIGSDFIVPPLQALARRLPGVPLLQFDLRKCPLPTACIDAVTALNVLEHIDDDKSALHQIWRILKPGGLAHIEVPAGPHLYDIYDEYLMHYRRYNLDHLENLAAETGFQVLKATHLGAWMYPAFAWVKKKNRRLLNQPAEEKKRIVANQIRTTSQSAMLRVLLKTELAFGKCISYRWGIRCVIVLRKPSSS